MLRLSIFIAFVAIGLSAGCPATVDTEPKSEGEGEEGEGAEGEGEGEEGEGEEGEGEEGEGEEGEGEGEVVDNVAVAVAVVTSSTLPGAIVDDSLRLLWEVASLASQTAGSSTAVLTGTLNLRGARPTYNAAPANELVYLDSNNIEVHFTVARFTGDFDQPTAREFYLQPHDVGITRVVVGEDDFSCSSILFANQSGSRTGGGISGGDTFTFNASVVVTSVFDNGTVDYVSVENRSGTVVNAALGTDLVFGDSSRYHVFASSSVVVEDLVNDLTVTGTAGGSSWSMQNGRIQRTFRNGDAVEPDFWAGTTGDLRRNAAPFATLAVRASAGAFEVVLVTTDADISVLETHAR